MIVRERGNTKRKEERWRKLSLKDEKYSYLEAMKICATKSCVSFVSDCKGNFSPFSQFFSLGFCYKRLLESMQEHRDWFVNLMGCENTRMSCQEPLSNPAAEEDTQTISQGEGSTFSFLVQLKLNIIDKPTVANRTQKNCSIKQFGFYGPQRTERIINEVGS